VFFGHQALLACFSLIVGCVGVAWWLRVFGCMIFVSFLWNKIIKGLHASIDADCRGWGMASFSKKIQIQHLSLNPHGHKFRLLFIVEDQAFLAGCLFIKD
jgi:hypothetical protein